jgi:hypothetical protein
LSPKLGFWGLRSTLAAGRHETCSCDPIKTFLWIVYNLSIQSDKAIWLIAKDDRFGCLSPMTKPHF